MMRGEERTLPAARDGGGCHKRKTRAGCGKRGIRGRRHRGDYLITAETASIRGLFVVNGENLKGAESGKGICGRGRRKPSLYLILRLVKNIADAVVRVEDSPVPETFQTVDTHIRINLTKTYRYIIAGGRGAPGGNRLTVGGHGLGRDIR